MRQRSFALGLLLFLGMASSAMPAAKLGLIGRLPQGRGEVWQAALLAGKSLAKAGMAVKLECLDDQGTVAGARAAAQRLADDPEVLAVVLEGEPAVAAEVLAPLVAAGLPAVAASSWATPRGLSPTAVRVWLCPSQQAMSRLAGEYCGRQMRLKQAAIVSDGSPTAAAAARAFSEGFSMARGLVGYRGEWQGSAWGLTRTVAEMAQHWPQVVFYSGPPEQAALLARAIRSERQIGHLLTGPEGLDPAFARTAGAAGKGLLSFCPAPAYTQVRRSSLGISARKAYAGFGAPGHPGPLVFDAVMLAGKVLQSATDRDSAGRGLDQAASYTGIQGRVVLAGGEPIEPRIALFSLWTRVNSKKVSHLFRAWGPPWKR